MVIGVDGTFGAHCATEDLDGAVGNDFIGVHVGLGAGTSLPDDERKVIKEGEGGDFGGGLLDRLPQLWVFADSPVSAHGGD